MKTRLEEINNVHKQLKLSGLPDNALLNVSEDLLSFLLSVLRNENPIAPNKSLHEWNELLSILRFHSIRPLLYWKIRSLPSERQPPKEIIETLRNSFLSSRVNFLRTEHQLKKVLSALKNAGIRTLVLKGVAMGKLVYPDPALRPFADIDLLVLPDQALRSRNVLLEQGYECPDKRLEDAKDFYFEEIFIPRNCNLSKFTIEIHWRLIEFSKVSEVNDIKDFFSRSMKLEYFNCMSPVDALLHQALHMAFRHTRDLKLIWICDIAQLSRLLKTPEDWRTLQKRSLELGARLAVEHCLELARAWCGIKIPEGFDDFSSWPDPGNDAQKVWANVIRKNDHTIGFIKLTKFPSGLFPKIKLILKILFPDPAIMRINFPPPHPWLLPLSYIRRWVKWFKI